MRGDDDNRQRRAGPVGPDRAREFEPVKFWHLKVGDDERDLRVAAEDHQRVAAVACGHDGIAGCFENAALELADGERVLDDEDPRRSRSPGPFPGGLLRHGRPPGALRYPGQHGRLDEKRDPAVTEDGCSQVSLDVIQERPERLDHDLLLAEQRVASCDDATASRGDEECRRLVRKWRRRCTDECGHVDDGQRPPADLQRGPAFEHECLAHRNDLFHGDQRHAVDRGAPPEEQHLQQGDREGKPQRDLHPAAGLAADLEGAAE